MSGEGEGEIEGPAGAASSIAGGAELHGGGGSVDLEAQGYLGAEGAGAAAFLGEADDGGVVLLGVVDESLLQGFGKPGFVAQVEEDEAEGPRPGQLVGGGGGRGWVVHADDGEACEVDSVSCGVEGVEAARCGADPDDGFVQALGVEDESEARAQACAGTAAANFDEPPGDFFEPPLQGSFDALAAFEFAAGHQTGDL